MTNIEKPGWHTRGYLPHFDAHTLVQHVVFRTKESLQQSILDAALPHMPAFERWRFFEDELDQSKSGTLFSNPIFAKTMQDALKYFDGDRYDLQAW